MPRPAPSQPPSGVVQASQVLALAGHSSAEVPCELDLFPIHCRQFEEAVGPYLANPVQSSDRARERPVGEGRTDSYEAKHGNTSISPGCHRRIRLVARL